MDSTVPIHPPRLLDQLNVARVSHIARGVSDRGTSWRQGTKLPKDSHQFIEEFLVVVADAEDVLLILFGQGALLRRAVSECVCRHGPSSVFNPCFIRGQCPDSDTRSWMA
jgi:hypothetical protein